MERSVNVAQFHVVGVQDIPEPGEIVKTGCDEQVPYSPVGIDGLSVEIKLCEGCELYIDSGACRSARHQIMTK